MAIKQCGGSDADAYISCTGAKKLRSLFIDESSDAARTGTALHYVMYELTASATTLSPDDVIGDVVDITEGGVTHGVELTQELIKYKLRPVYDWVRAQRSKLLFEKTVSFDDKVLPGFSGTADVIDVDTGACIDYKFGQVFVSASAIQPLFYLSAALDCNLLSARAEYHAVIIQPDDYGNIQPRIANYSHRDLLAFKADLKIALDNHRIFDAEVDKDPLALYDPDYYSEGEHCRFCRAKTVCPLKIESAKSLVRPLELSEGRNRLERIINSKEKLSDLYFLAKSAKSWATAVEEQVKKEFKEKGRVSGLTREPAQHRYTFKDPNAVAVLLSQGYPEEGLVPKSPLQTVRNWGLNENLLNKEVIAYKFRANENEIEIDDIINSVTI